MNTSCGLRGEDVTVAALRTLYERYGYAPYKMSKFEEYDLYVRNKDFLISDSIITFTDTNGKLMALKPDVTLSIVKNTADVSEGVRKVYYDEHVYRVAKSTHNFREIRQVGLECLGTPDAYCLSEVLLLAAESLKTLSDEAVLDVSHLGIVTGVLDLIGVPEQSRAAVLKCIGEKNRHELSAICLEAGVEDSGVALLCDLVASYGAPEDVLPKILALLHDTPLETMVEQLANTLAPLIGKASVNVDFSVVSDVRFYNGIVFKGFISGIPGAVLSGGQYDRLLHKMGKAAGAIGFAVYLNMLEDLLVSVREYDADDVLLYEEGEMPGMIATAVSELQKDGGRVLALCALPEKISCRRVWKLTGSEVELLETRS